MQRGQRECDGFAEDPIRAFRDDVEKLTLRNCSLGQVAEVTL
jgi:hypothetical protein